MTTDTPTPAAIDATPNAPTSRMISEQPASSGGFDLDAAFKAAEAEMSAVNRRIETNLSEITRLKASVAADRAKLKDIERMLSSRTPRTRSAKK